jgi:hypothetical protein
MSFCIVTSSGKVLSQTTVQRVKNLELQANENKVICVAFTAAIDQHVGGHVLVPHDENGELQLSDDWDNPNSIPS